MVITYCNSHFKMRKSRLKLTGAFKGAISIRAMKQRMYSFVASRKNATKLRSLGKVYVPSPINSFLIFSAYKHSPLHKENCLSQIVHLTVTCTLQLFTIQGNMFSVVYKREWFIFKDPRELLLCWYILYIKGFKKLSIGPKETSKLMIAVCRKDVV